MDAHTLLILQSTLHWITVPTDLFYLSLTVNSWSASRLSAVINARFKQSLWTFYEGQQKKRRDTQDIYPFLPLHLTLQLSHWSATWKTGVKEKARISNSQRIYLEKCARKHQQKICVRLKFLWQRFFLGKIVFELGNLLWKFSALDWINIWEDLEQVFMKRKD